MNYKKMQYAPEYEEIVDYLVDATGLSDRHFIRVAIAYYLAIPASTQQANVLMPGGDRYPINVYVMALLASGQGKGLVTSVLENELLEDLNKTFHHRWKDYRDISIENQVPNRASAKGIDDEEAREEIQKEFKVLGPPLLKFSEGTSPGFKQMRTALLRAGYGSLNVVVDEILAVSADIGEIMKDLIISFDEGRLAAKLIKNTSENPRQPDSTDAVPANMLLFGSGSQLADPTIHSKLFTLIDTGLGRRTFFAYNDTADEIKTTAKELLNKLISPDLGKTKSHITAKFAEMNRSVMYQTDVLLPDDVALEWLEYRIDCERRATQIRNTAIAAEMKHRRSKVIKLAGAFAMYCGTTRIEMSHLHTAIKLAEDGGQAIKDIVYTQPLHEQVAHFLAEHPKPVTMAALLRHLPWLKQLNKGDKAEMVQLAIEYGYDNNIVLEVNDSGRLTTYSAQGIEKNDLSKMLVAYSNDKATNYRNVGAPWDKMPHLWKQQGVHWTTHHFTNGNRHTDSTIPGFNMMVLDIDNKDHPVPAATAAELLKEYKFFLYHTKRSEPNVDRYRIVLPLSHTLKLDELQYKQFCINIYNELPFAVDEATNQRSRKWLAFDGASMFNEGELFPAVDYIPGTEKSEDVILQRKEFKNMDALQRWFIKNIEYKGEGRNNTLYRYAEVLRESGQSLAEIESGLLVANGALTNPMEESRIRTTILKTIASKMAGTQ